MPQNILSAKLNRLKNPNWYETDQIVFYLQAWPKSSTRVLRNNSGLAVIVELKPAISGFRVQCPNHFFLCLLRLLLGTVDWLLVSMFNSGSNYPWFMHQQKSFQVMFLSVILYFHCTLLHLDVQNIMVAVNCWLKLKQVWKNAGD